MKSITPHSLRHSNSTIGLMKGIPLKTVAVRLGNTSMIILSLNALSFKKLEFKLVQACSEAFTFKISGIFGGCFYFNLS